ncbi:WD repeat-containing protein 76 isoform X3 [Amborella trichopoda]|uniref:WD repeat-containing protein 76 isoform X3 n=1 Tax=Amborella trichopoda TaxID=13333 RepID=UPI0009C14D0A|nr:WD repeat-containing protein 76 isoform X3 [Amborella trichopoda]|eukprot:XP_020525731.1 WD repeat-containing protein 76 isoform X3 [Amborella trichopoda]
MGVVKRTRLQNIEENKPRKAIQGSVKKEEEEEERIDGVVKKGEEGMTEYERRRVENIERNQRMLASLNVQSLRSSVATKHPRVEPKGYKKIPERKQVPIVLRRSLRTGGIPPDASSAKGGHDDMPCIDHLSSSSSTSVPIKKRMGSFTMGEVYESKKFDVSDNHFIDTVIGLSDKSPLSRIGVKKVEAFEVGQLRLKADNVARLVPGRILSLGFFPCLERTVVVAGDKLGYVGFWDTDDKEGDGVYTYCPHSAAVSGVVVRPFHLTKIFTSSYDGSIRLMNVEDGNFDMIYHCDDEVFALSTQTCDMNSLYFAEGQGELKVWDERTKGISNSYSLHSRRINTIDFNPENDNIVCTSSNDGEACIWDLRCIRDDPLQKVKHQKAILSAFFSPTGQYLATTSSLDNRVGLSSGVDFSEISMIHHYNNHANSGQSFFRAIWGWDDSYLFVGNMKRAVDVIYVVNRTTSSLDSTYMTASPCRA